MYTLKNISHKGEHIDYNEDYKWIDYNTTNYFCLCTRSKCMIPKGSQVYYCYGARSNRYLLMNYGFCIDNNKYESASLHLLRPSCEDDLNIIGKAIYEPNLWNELYRTKYEQITTIKLKKRQLCTDLLSYIRLFLVLKSNVEFSKFVFTQPCNVKFEQSIVRYALILLRGIYL